MTSAILSLSGKCLAAAEAKGHHWQRVLASRAATLTGCRLDEIEGLLKTEVDVAGMALRLGDTKTGKSIRPVGSAVIAAVKAASSKSKSKYVFPAITTNAKHHTGLTRWLQKIAGRDVPGITSNGLRHYFQLDGRGSWLFASDHQSFGRPFPRERDRGLHPQDQLLRCLQPPIRSRVTSMMR